jgi:hypothetical protein
LSLSFSEIIKAIPASLLFVSLALKFNITCCQQCGWTFRQKANSVKIILHKCRQSSNLKIHTLANSTNSVYLKNYFYDSLLLQFTNTSSYI